MADEAVFAHTAPTAEERDGYYYGLPSRPKLVARSSTDVWSHQHDGWSIGKNFGPVGHHAIAKPWNDSTSSLRRAIVQALEGIDWSTIDILRIGYERTHGFTGEEFAQPVTLLISVQKDSTTWAQGLPVVMRCREILQLHGIPDVHCEMRESHFIRGASSPGQAPASAPRLVGGQVDFPTETRGLWSEYPGLSIAAYGHPEREGTKCLYLRLKDSGKIVALTCRHVIFEASTVEPEFKHTDSDVQARHTIIQPGDLTLLHHKKSTSKLIDAIDIRINELESHPTMPENTKRRMMQQARDSLWPLVRTKRDLSELENSARRIFGHVIYAPKFSVSTTDRNGSRLRDWALIELHAGKYTTPLDNLRNQVFVGDARRAERQVINACVSEGLTGISRILFDTQSHTVWLDGTLPETEMRKPFEEVRSLGKDPAILVAKHGAATGFTVGLATGIKSLIRHPLEDGPCFQSEEWCIIGQRRNSQGRREDFSSGGDSGSCVWDRNGRIGGMLAGGSGSGSNGAFDVSYATPMEWLLDDIKAHGYDVELV
ncbi:hypothetical protein EDB81DRAFT_837954 [Dactylonectria macrodidyma]|uniref:Uncharacterized protein n=1 Tax=Dactylonectria macrodidyma TaxID=307937 RepID=A0A9P9FS04_9HYPO|nr:hypothetical protein EDB81DRAFT_837954 [Dactylonectria macrodidyma]